MWFIQTSHMVNNDPTGFLWLMQLMFRVVRTDTTAVPQLAAVVVVRYLGIFPSIKF